MATNQTFPQLSFAINGEGADNTIYITTDPTVNKLTLVVNTNTPNTVYTPGQLTPPGEAASATGSLLYLDLSSLQIPVSDFNKIVCTAEGWTYQLYANSIIGITPTENTITQQPGEAVNIGISNLVLPNPPAAPNVNLSVGYYRVDPITIGDLEQVSFFKVLLQAAPGDKKDLHEAIGCALTSPSFIVNTIDGYSQVDNTISFALQPGASPVTVNAGPQTTFTVSFVYADSPPGYGALTTPQKAVNNIRVVQGQNAAAWSVTPNQDAKNPCWIMQPPDQAPIIGTGTGSVVSFDILSIITRFEPGPTLMYVQYQNVPGYNDGAYFIILNKVPHVAINNMRVAPNPAVIKNGEAVVDITWEAKDSVSLMLMPFYQDVTGKNRFRATLKKSTVITLVAQGAASSANQATATVTADVLPVINSFNVTPTNIYYNNYPHDAKFFWDVDTNGTVMLVNDNTQSSESVPKRSNTIKRLNSPGMWSLIPQDDANPYSLARNVLIQSFKNAPQTNPIGFSPFAAVASPSAEFIAVLNNADGKVAILNALDFSEYTTPVDAGGSPIDEVFANSGKYLFVLNGNGSLAIIKISYNAGVYSFTSLAPIAIAGTPARIAISNDDKYVFITTALSGAGKLVVVQQTGEDQFSIKQSLSTNPSPGGIAVDPAGINVYTTIGNCNSVAVFGYSSVDDAFTYNRSISNLPANPVDVAVADPQGKTLLIACTASNQLMVVDYDDDGTTPRQSIPINSNPVRIATTPDRAYAFIANHQSNNVALISCFGGTQNCIMLEPELPAGKQPRAISVSSDSTTAYISTSENRVTQFNLVNYQLRNTLVAVGNQPTNAAVSADGAKVAMWHDVFNISGKPNFTKGFFIYETSSGSVSTRLPDTSLVQCLFSPDAAQPLMYLTQKDAATISIFETSRFTLKATIAIPTGVGGTQRFPVTLGMSANAENLYTVTRDSGGKYSFIAYSCNEATGTYTVTTDVDVFTNTVTANVVLMANTPDANNVFVLSSSDKKIWNLARNSAGVYELNAKTIVLPYLTRCMAIAPDNTTLYVLMQQNLNSAMTVVNVNDLSANNFPFPASYSLQASFQQAVVSPDGSRLFITDANITGVRIMSTATLRIIQTLSSNQDLRFPMGIAMQRNASALYLTGYGSANMATVNQINTATIGQSN
jgi:DNA-binding beta-propeller fold protein YncE